MARITQVTVGFKGTIPTQPFGGVTVNAEWVAELEPGEDAETVQRELTERIKAEVAIAVAPIAQAKVKHLNGALNGMSPKQREEFEQKIGPLVWLAAVMAEAEFGKLTGKNQES